MRKKYIITRAARNLKQAKVRTILTALAIAVGATTICLALAAGNGGRDYIDNMVGGTNTQELSAYGKIDDGKMKAIPPEIVDKIRSMPELEKSTTDAEQDASISGVSYITAKVKDGVDTREVQKQIATFSDDITTNSIYDTRKSLFDAVNIAQWGLIGFGALAVIASVFGIINTQYISVLERTRQIGLMKALGMKRRDVSRLFRYEAAWIGFIGGVIGVAIAWLISLANPLISSFLSIKDGIHLLRVDPLQATILVACLMLVSVVSGWFPARKAAKLDPIEALRTE